MSGVVITYLALNGIWSTAPEKPTESSISSETPQLGPVEDTYPYTIDRNSTLASSLGNLDISASEVYQIVLAAKPIKNLAKLQSGTKFQVFYSSETPTQLVGIKIKLSHQEILHVKKLNQAWSAETIRKKVETRVVTFKGVVSSSLWESALEAQMNPTLISELAEIFAWQVDFAREVQEGDRWRLSVEEELINGEHIGWGEILSAEYVNRSETHTAILFRQGDKDMGYFTPEGESLRRMFLKSPIQYGRISSRFQKKRFHPVLKISRPHLGVDYAAPTGTPIRAVGDGVVAAIGYNGGAGNMINIRHNSTYSTAYKHLSRYASGLKKGARVQQGQTIGYVGSTGLSSGAHLHFEFYVNNRFVDPMGQKFPNADPISRSRLAEFFEIQKNFLAYLPSWDQDKKVVQDRTSASDPQPEALIR